MRVSDQRTQALLLSILAPVSVLWPQYAINILSDRKGTATCTTTACRRKGKAFIKCFLAFMNKKIAAADQQNSLGTPNNLFAWLLHTKINEGDTRKSMHLFIARHKVTMLAAEHVPNKVKAAWINSTSVAEAQQRNLINERAHTCVLSFQLRNSPTDFDSSMTTQIVA